MFVCLFVCSSPNLILMHHQGVFERDIALSPPATKPLSHNKQWAKSSLFVRVLMGIQTLTLVNCSLPNFHPPYYRIASLLLQGQLNLSTLLGGGLEPGTFRSRTQSQQLNDGVLMRSDSALSAVLTVNISGLGYSRL